MAETSQSFGILLLLTTQIGKTTEANKNWIEKAEVESQLLSSSLPGIFPRSR